MMKTIEKYKNAFMCREYILVSILIIFAILLSISQTILYVLHTPPGYTFLFIHNFIEDYYYYLHLMRQGWEGYWTATSWLTPEVYPGAVLNVFFLLLGHMARIFHIGIPMMYLFARISGGVLLLILVYVLIQKIFPKDRSKRIGAFVLVLFGTYWWGWQAGRPAVSLLAHQWTELDPIFRWSYIPHHLWSKVGMVSLIVLLIKPKKSVGYLLTISALTALTGLINPVVYATFLPLIGLWAGLEFLRNTEQRKNVWFYLPWICIVFSALVVGLYHRNLSLTLFPWTSYEIWEKTLQYSVRISDYAISLGPNFVLFLLAVPLIWRYGRTGTLLIAWVASSWVMLFGFRFLVPVTVERYLGGYQFIPIGIGAAEGLFFIAKRIIRKDYAIIVAGMLFLLMVYHFIGLSASLKEHRRYIAENATNPQVYIPDDLMHAFSYIEKETLRQSVVLAPYWISTMLPALTGTRVIGGHVLMTYLSGEKQKTLADFFAGVNVSPSDLFEKYNVVSVLAPVALQLPYKVVFHSDLFNVYSTQRMNEN